MSALAPLPTSGLSQPEYVDTVLATAAPPTGWTRDILRKSPRHTHEVWISPTRTTAYGVMHFALPVPVGPDIVEWYFLREMRRKQGDAVLISSQKDPNLPGIRFVAEGGPYRIHVNLMTRGWEGWAVYAGTLRGQPINQNELDLAERAREYTQVGAAEKTRNPG